MPWLINPWQRSRFLVKSGKIFKIDLSHFLIMRKKLPNISHGVLMYSTVQIYVYIERGFLSGNLVGIFSMGTHYQFYSANWKINLQLKSTDYYRKQIT